MDHARTLFGREQELTALREALLSRVDGAAAAIVAEGEVGLGKTSILKAACERAAELGFDVATAGADELSRYRAFGVLAEAFDTGPGSQDPLAASLHADLSTAWLDARDRPSAADWRFRAVEGFVDLCEARTATRPLLLALDDVQWVDGASLHALDVMFRRLATRPLLVLVTCRVPVRRRGVRALVDALLETGAQSIRLEALAPEAVELLATAVVGGVPGPALLRRLGDAGGNPLFVTELLRALRDSDALSSDGGCVELRTTALPADARGAIMRRLEFLPKACVETLQVAAVAGRVFDADLVAASLGRPIGQTLTGLGTARDAGILRETRDGHFEFRHDLLREVLYDSLGPAGRRSLHRDVGRQLAARGGDDVVVAHHLRLGASGNDREAIHWLRRAATVIETSAPALAAELLEHALALSEGDVEGESEMRLQLATALRWWGRMEDSIREARAVLAGAAPPSVQVRARAALAEALGGLGRWQDAVAEAVTAAGSPLSGIDGARALADSAIFRAYVGDLDGAWQQADEAQRLADGDDATFVSARCGQATVLMVRGEFEKAAALATVATERARRSGDDEARRRHPQVPLAWMLCEGDRFDDAAAVIAEGRSIGDRIGTWQLPLYHFAETFRAYPLGDWDVAVTAAEAAFPLTEETGARLCNVFGHACLALMAIDRADLDAAAAQVDAAQREIARTGGSFGVDWLALAGARLQEAAGMGEQALQSLAGVWDMSEAAGVSSHRRLFGPTLARLAVANGDRDRAEAVASALAELAQRTSVASVSAAALLCAGLAADDDVQLVRAVEAYRSTPRAVERAMACEQAGTRMLSSGADDGTRLLGEAAEIYEAAGALAALGRCEAALRRAGVRRGRRTRRTQARHGWSSLTPTEAAVTRMAGQGLTNAEIAGRLYISRYTVETHLKHVYAKLGLRSRVELVREVTLRDTRDKPGDPEIPGARDGQR